MDKRYCWKAYSRLGIQKPPLLFCNPNVHCHVQNGLQLNPHKLDKSTTSTQEWPLYTTTNFVSLFLVLITLLELLTTASWLCVTISWISRSITSLHLDYESTTSRKRHPFPHKTKLQVMAGRMFAHRDIYFRVALERRYEKYYCQNMPSNPSRTY
jgi:hypothetical protein